MNYTTRHQWLLVTSRFDHISTAASGLMHFIVGSSDSESTSESAAPLDDAATIRRLGLSDTVLYSFHHFMDRLSP